MTEISLNFRFFELLKDVDNLDKALLILDLDETLIHASHTKLSIDESSIVFDYYIYERPFLSKFLDSVCEHYKMAIWSSASDDYVEEVVNRTILKNYSFDFVWGRTRATFRRNYHHDELRNYGSFDDHYQYVKPLKKLKRKGYIMNRILIVDDSPHKCQLNYGNAIYPKPYEGDQEDNELEMLSAYLLEIKDHKNFRTLEKRNWRSKYRENKMNTSK